MAEGSERQRERKRDWAWDGQLVLLKVVVRVSQREGARERLKAVARAQQSVASWVCTTAPAMGGRWARRWADVWDEETALPMGGKKGALTD